GWRPTPVVLVGFQHQPVAGTPVRDFVRPCTDRVTVEIGGDDSGTRQLVFGYDSQRRPFGKGCVGIAQAGHHGLFVGSLDVLDGVEVGGNTAADVVIEYLAIGEGNIATGQSMSIMEFNVVAQGVRVR